MALTVATFAAATARAADANDVSLGGIVVTATRISESSSDIPASIDRVEAEVLQRGQLQVNLSEALITVPGVSV